MPERKGRQKGLRVSNLALFLDIFKWHHGSEGVNGLFGTIHSSALCRSSAVARLLLKMKEALFCRQPNLLTMKDFLTARSVDDERGHVLLTVKSVDDERDPVLLTAKSLETYQQCCIKRFICFLQLLLLR